MLMPENVFLAVNPLICDGIGTRRSMSVMNQRHGMKAAFVFTNKSRSRIKVTAISVWLCVRRLHKGHFRWPRAMSCPVLTPDEFNWLVSGVDWQQVKGNDLAKIFRDAEFGTKTTYLMNNNDYPCRYGIHCISLFATTSDGSELRHTWRLPWCKIRCSRTLKEAKTVSRIPLDRRQQRIILLEEC